MRSGQFYTHVNMLDCMFRVLDIFYVDDTSASFKVEWWVKRGFRLPVSQELVVIKHQDLPKWYRMGP